MIRRVGGVLFMLLNSGRMENVLCIKVMKNGISVWLNLGVE